MNFVSELRDEYTTDEDIAAMKEAIDACKAPRNSDTGFTHPSWTPEQLVNISTTHNMLYHNLDWHEYIEMTRSLLMEGATPTGPFEEKIAVAKALLSFDPSHLPGMYTELERMVIKSPWIGDLYSAMAAIRLRIFQPDLALSLLQLATLCSDHIPSLHKLILDKVTWMRRSWYKKVNESIVVGVTLDNAGVYDRIKKSLTTLNYDVLDPLIRELRDNPSQLFPLWQKSSAFANFVYETELRLDRGQELLLRPLTHSQVDHAPILKLEQKVYDNILKYTSVQSTRDMLLTCREMYTKTRVESSAWLHFAHKEIGIEPAAVPQFWIQDMAEVMANVRSTAQLIKAFETLDMTDNDSQQRVLDAWLTYDSYSMETVSQCPCGAELMEIATISFFSRLLSLLTIDAPIGAMATYFVKSNADPVGALLNVMRMRLRAATDSCLYHQLLSLLVLSKSPLANDWHQRLLDGGLETICRHQIERNEMEGVNASLLIASLHSRHFVNLKYLDCTMFSQVGDVATKISPQLGVSNDSVHSDGSGEEREEMMSASTASSGGRSGSSATIHREEEQWRLNPMERMSGFWRISLVPATHADFQKIDLGFFDVCFEETNSDASSGDDGEFDIAQNPTLRVRGPGILASKAETLSLSKPSSEIEGFFDATSLKLTFHIESSNDSLFCSAIAFPLGFGGYFGRLNDPSNAGSPQGSTVNILGAFVMWRDLRPFSPDLPKLQLTEEIEKVRSWYDFKGDDYRPGKSELAHAVDALPASTPLPFFSVVQRRPHMWLMVNTFSMLVWKLSLWESADYTTLRSMDENDTTAPAFRNSGSLILKQRCEFESDDIFMLRLKAFEAASSSLYYSRLALTLSYTMAEVMADLSIVHHAMRVVYRHPKCRPEFLKDSAAFDDLESISPGKRISIGNDSERFVQVFDALMQRVEKTSTAFAQNQYSFRQACSNILALAFDPETYGASTDPVGKNSFATEVKAVWEKWRRRWSQIHPALFSTSAPAILDRPCSLDEIQLMLSHAAYQSSAKGEQLYFDDLSDSSSEDDDKEKPIIKPRSIPSSVSTASTVSTSTSGSNASSPSGYSPPNGPSSPSDSSPESSTLDLYKSNGSSHSKRDSRSMKYSNGVDQANPKSTSSVVNSSAFTKIPLVTAIAAAATLSLGAFLVGRWLSKSNKA